MILGDGYAIAPRPFAFIHIIATRVVVPCVNVICLAISHVAFTEADA
jgi:hypothetical protein